MVDVGVGVAVKFLSAIAFDKSWNSSTAQVFQQCADLALSDLRRLSGLFGRSILFSVVKSWAQVGHAVATNRPSDWMRSEKISKTPRELRMAHLCKVCTHEVKTSIRLT